MREIKKQTCSICGNTLDGKLKTYKQYYRYCRVCNNIIREERKYLIEEVFPLKTFKFNEHIHGFMEQFYHPDHDPYEDYGVWLTKNENDMNRYEKRTLFNFNADFKRNYTLFKRELDYDLKDKVVLDVSGGPGIFARELSKICNKVYLTEYQEKSVEAMEHALPQCTVFKYNALVAADSFDAIKEKVDAVFVRNVIFCLSDIKKISVDISRVVKPNGYVLIESFLPTAGMAIRYSFLDYGCQILWCPETVKRTFLESNLCMKREGLSEYISTKDKGPFSKGPFRGKKFDQKLMILPSVLRALLGVGGFPNRDLNACYYWIIMTTK